MKITTVTKVKKNNVETYTGTLTVQQLVDFLTTQYIDTDKGDYKVRVNIPGQGWVYLENISSVFGEVYLGLPLDEAKELEISLPVKNIKEIKEFKETLKK